MLTKEERNAIAERLHEYEYIYDDVLYRVLFGCNALEDATIYDNNRAVQRRIRELCDTSNMVELPLDKDGEVIRVDDTVFNVDGEKLSVTSIRFSTGLGCIVICENDDSISTYAGNELTHKSNATVKALSDNIRGILTSEKSNVDDVSYIALMRIADQLKELAGKDD